MNASKMHQAGELFLFAGCIVLFSTTSFAGADLFTLSFSSTLALPPGDLVGFVRGVGSAPVLLGLWLTDPATLSTHRSRPFE